MAKSTKSAPSVEDDSSVVINPQDNPVVEETPTVEETPVEEVPVVEEAPANWGGHPTRAYRSFAVPYGAAVVESINTPPVDGEQEESQV
jgi:hypothetical protein